jgi:hypothetical protein
MQFDPITLGFNFAKDLAVQLITLSTGLLALSATFTKEILKTISASKDRLLRASWIIHVVSIIFGVWTIMALTGTLMPGTPKVPGSPFQFGSNVRVPAGLQILLFLLGTVFLLIVYGSRSGKPGEAEFKVITETPEKLGAVLKNLGGDRWEPVSFSMPDPGKVVALLKRSA